MNPPISRRQFLQRNVAAALAASALPALVPVSVLGRAGQTAPNSRVTVGCIGVGPQGRGVMSNFLPQADCRVIALCDVSQRNLDQAVKMVNAAPNQGGVIVAHDYRELLARKGVDAVLIATPDHWHVPVAIAAARANKDIYLEKPMGLSVEEDQRLRKLCQRNKRIFQFGTQQRSSSQFRQACELVRNGRIGKLQQINVWSSASMPGGSTAPAQTPADLKYDFWLGPAPQKPYTLGKAYDSEPPATWKTWWFNYDYALGFIAGWGVHPLDIAYWGHPAMMKAPLDVQGQAVFPKEGACNTSVAWDVNFVFADDVRLTYRGTRNGAEPCAMNDLSAWQKKYSNIVDHGTAFEGSEGWVLVDRTQIRVSPETLVEWKPGPSDVQLTRSSNHVRNFLDSIRSRTPAICPIEDAVQADVLCHLSDLATRLNRKLKWDPAKEKFVQDAEANQRLAIRSTRKPWAVW
jgi:glucose-fructose oxidoreductase